MSSLLLEDNSQRNNEDSQLFQQFTYQSDQQVPTDNFPYHLAYQQQSYPLPQWCSFYAEHNKENIPLNYPYNIPGLSLPKPLHIPAPASTWFPSTSYINQEPQATLESQTDALFQTQFQNIFNQHVFSQQRQEHQRQQQQQQQEHHQKEFQQQQLLAKTKRNLFKELIIHSTSNNQTHSENQAEEASRRSPERSVLKDINKNENINKGGIKAEISQKTGTKYNCSHCPKGYTLSHNYQRHLLSHGKRPYKCDVCEKTFLLVGHLKIHTRTHTGEKPYECKDCGRCFAQFTNLHRHMLIHTGEKPHICTHCSKGFTSSSDLRRHIRTHTGEKPYKCRDCKKSFATSGNLQTHTLTHTGEKPFSCSSCGWRFTSSSNLRAHVMTHHSREKDTENLQTVLGIETEL